MSSPATGRSNVRTPPLWLGASSAAAVRRAARLGYPWFTSAHTPYADLVALASVYRAALAERGQGIPERAVLWRHLHIAVDRETALREARPFLASYYEQFAQWGLFRDVVRSTADVTVDDILADGRVIVGSPDDALHALLRYRQSTGLPNVVCRVGWSAMPVAVVERSLQLLAERVVPRLRAVGDVPGSTGKDWREVSP